MAIIAQKVYQKCKIWLLFAALCWGVHSCKKEHNAGLAQMPKEWLATKAEMEAYSAIDSSKAFLLVKKFQKQHPNSELAQVICLLGYAETYRSWYNNALATEYAKKAASAAKKLGYLEGQVQAELLIVETTKECDTCLDYLLNVEKTIQSNTSALTVKTIFRFYHDMGYYHYEISDIETSKYYFFQGIELAKTNQLPLQESILKSALGSVFTREGNLNKAITFHQQAIAQCQQHAPTECGNHYYEYAIALLELKRYDDALKAILTAQNLYKAHPHPFNAGEIDGMLGTIYLKQKNYEEAEKSYLTFYKKARFSSTKIWAHNLLTNYYYTIGDFKNAYINSQKSIKMRDSVYSNERTYTSVAKRTNFELAQKDEEVQTANVRLRYAIVIGICIILAALALGFLIYRNHQLANQLTLLEQEQLQQKIDFEQRKLATTTLHLSQQSDLLRNIKKEIEQLNENAEPGLRTKIKHLLKIIDGSVNDQDEWGKFKLHFEAVSPHFFEVLRQRSSSLTELDLKHCAYLKINLSPKQVAQILGVSPKSVTLSRVRIKKKLQLDEHEQLNTYLQSI
ncbi:MAG TPA: hypothetical protein DCM71_17260 [Runella sp.]|nr:hypothetical protein [Runella sp.]